MLASCTMQGIGGRGGGAMFISPAKRRRLATRESVSVSGRE